MLTTSDYAGIAVVLADARNRIPPTKEAHDTWAIVVNTMEMFFRQDKNFDGTEFRRMANE